MVGKSGCAPNSFIIPRSVEPALLQLGDRELVDAVGQARRSAVLAGGPVLRCGPLHAPASYNKLLNNLAFSKITNL